jgi:hypothetical protein
VENMPAEVLSAAFRMHAAVQERRVRALHAQQRAVFAEFVVAALLGDEATVVPDPGAAWDITWDHDDAVVRIQVKCSGELRPRAPTRRTPAVWSIRKPASGWDPQERCRIGSGHHCEVFVLARHEGDNIEAGWRFLVLPTASITVDGLLDEQSVLGLGAIACAPAELSRAVAMAAGV